MFYFNVIYLLFLACLWSVRILLASTQLVKLGFKVYFRCLVVINSLLHCHLSVYCMQSIKLMLCLLYLSTRCNLLVFPVYFGSFYVSLFAFCIVDVFELLINCLRKSLNPSLSHSPNRRILLHMYCVSHQMKRKRMLYEQCMNLSTPKC